MERCKSKRVIKAIVYGNIASPLPKKREEDNHTHQWTVFVKPYYNEDPSKFIRKVQFKLHESYANSIRMVEKPPFEVSETGWGEFEVQMKIYFIDPAEKPIVAFHYLRLFHPQVTLTNGKTIVAAEYYDEIVFQEPTVTMYKALTSSETRKCDPKRFNTDFVQVRKRTKELVEEARKKINGEVEDLKESLKEAQKLIEKYRKEVETLENNAINGNVDTADEVSTSLTGENTAASG
uniref:YEATS domain-containing protein 4 n=1 Tax=Syphacia muris TaxID=451379 RepID=A0A0N5AP33_9BILA